MESNRLQCKSCNKHTHKKKLLCNRVTFKIIPIDQITAAHWPVPIALVSLKVNFFHASLHQFVVWTHEMTVHFSCAHAFLTTIQISMRSLTYMTFSIHLFQFRCWTTKKDVHEINRQWKNVVYHFKRNRNSIIWSIWSA